MNKKVQITEILIYNIQKYTEIQITEKQQYKLQKYINTN